MRQPWDMTFLGMALGKKLSNAKWGNAAAIARKIGMDESILSRIRKGEIAAGNENVLKLFRAFSSDREFQAELIRAHIFDNLPKELHQFVEITLAVPGTSKRRQFAEPPPDELQTAVNALSPEGRDVAARFVRQFVELYPKGERTK